MHLRSRVRPACAAEVARGQEKTSKFELRIALGLPSLSRLQRQDVASEEAGNGWGHGLCSPNAVRRSRDSLRLLKREYETLAIPPVGTYSRF